MDWFRGLQPPVQAAIIAGSVALVTAIVTAVATFTNTWLKDRLDRRLEEARSQRVQRETYRRYADPLTSAATSLYWRLREVFEIGGSYYLAVGGGATRFEEYKAFSTQYRLASVLGWITALEKELVLCDAQPDRSVESMRRSISRVQQSLAEGGHVEVARARRLSSLWQVDLSDGSEGAAGRAVDAALKRFMHTQEVVEPRALGSAERLKLLRSVAAALSDVTGEEVDIQVLREVASEACEALSTREAWFYRDWQSAIGDLMLELPDGSPRRFDVKGYRAFTELTSSGSASDKAWLDRLAEITEDLDVDRDPSEDARIEQLKGVYDALARLLVEFHRAEPDHSSISAETLAAANATLSLVSGGSS
ncbi:MAG TPA: hypothetical protein PKE05_02590 [Microthrixaceae bacterium]|nr:hypothetical protein [Microthrixaceae bacterium]